MLGIRRSGDAPWPRNSPAAIRSVQHRRRSCRRRLTARVRPGAGRPHRRVKPVVVSSANGNRYKNGGPVTGVQKAFELITKGTDVLDALIAGVNLCELDPEDTSVGYGGLPNADGVVQLDSCCMHGPTKRAGGVACIEGVRTPSLVAKAVLEHTDHHLLVGKGAQDFARNMGFKIEDDLNTETSRSAVARVEAPHRSRALPRSEEARRGDARWRGSAWCATG